MMLCLTGRGVPFLKYLSCWGAAAALACGPGAVDDLPRQAVSGRVTLDGAPLPHGSIQFTPTSELPTPALVPVNEGHYSIPRAQGLVPGSYKVSVTGGGEDAPIEPVGEMPGRAARQHTEAADKQQRAAVLGKKASSSIPGRYNTATTLVAEVKQGGSNVFDFELTSGDSSKK